MPKITLVCVLHFILRVSAIRMAVLFCSFFWNNIQSALLRLRWETESSACTAAKKKRWRALSQIALWTDVYNQFPNDGDLGSCKRKYYILSVKLDLDDKVVLYSKCMPGRILLEKFHFLFKRFYDYCSNCIVLFWRSILQVFCNLHLHIYPVQLHPRNWNVPRLLFST